MKRSVRLSVGHVRRLLAVECEQLRVLCGEGGKRATKDSTMPCGKLQGAGLG